MSESPPDYAEALAAAIERLKKNTRAARGTIYDRARKLLLEEAQSADPPWQLVEIVREQRALEEAIEEVEALYAEKPEQVIQPRPARAASSRRPAPALPARRPARPERADDDIETEPTPDEWTGEDQPRPPLPPAVIPRSPSRDRRYDAQASALAAVPWWAWASIGVLVLIIIALLILLLRSEPPPPAAPPPTAKTTAAPTPSPEELARRAREQVERGNELSRAQNFEGAIAAYGEAIRLVPTDASPYINRAYAHWSRGETDRAIADYDAAVRLDPDNIVARTNRAVAYNFRGDYDLAIRDLDHALRLKPDSPDILNSRCWGRALAGQMQAALSDCNESLRLRPNDPNTLDSRGFTHLKMGEIDRAIADYDAALKQNPKLAGALYGRGMAKLRKGDKTGGNTDVAAAKAMRPEIETIFARYGLK
jgi:tetratricopeptide (TPR) repeat protein